MKPVGSRTWRWEPLYQTPLHDPGRRGRGPGWSQCWPGLSFPIDAGDQNRKRCRVPTGPTSQRGPTPAPGGRAPHYSQSHSPARVRGQGAPGCVRWGGKQETSWVSTPKHPTPLATRQVASTGLFPFCISVSYPPQICGHSDTPGAVAPRFSSHRVGNPFLSSWAGPRPSSANQKFRRVAGRGRLSSGEGTRSVGLGPAWVFPSYTSSSLGAPPPPPGSPRTQAGLRVRKLALPERKRPRVTSVSLFSKWGRSLPPFPHRETAARPSAPRPASHSGPR